METKRIELNGSSTGFVVEVVGGTGTNKYILASGKPRIFDNLEVARITANRYCTNKKFCYHIKVDQNNMIPLEQFQKLESGEYQTVIDDTILTVKEKRSYCTTGFGYLVFNDGDSRRIEDKDEGFKIQKELFRECINWVTPILLLQQTDSCGISKIKRKNGEVILDVNGTTGKVHICFINKMMSQNQQRKEEGLRVLPFDKSLDKYTCFYVYSTKDMSESKNLRGNEHINEVINTIVKLIQEEFANKYPLKYKKLESDRYVVLEEEE